MDSSCSVVEWRNLPKNLLLMIAKRSDEIPVLRAVCSSWRSSLPPVTKSSPLFSLTIPLPNIDNEGSDLKGGAHFTLIQRSVYCLEPQSGGKITNEYGSRSSWMVKLEETSSGKMRMCNAISNYPLPDQRGRKKYPALLNLSNFRVLLAGKEYNLHPHTDVGRKAVDAKIRVRKLVISELDDAILCIFNEGEKLGFFKFGNESWIIIDDGNNTVPDYSDIIYHQGRFYVIENNGKIGVINSSLKVEAFVYPACQARRCMPNFFRFNYFVQSNGDLYVAEKSYDSYYYGSDDDDNDYYGFGRPDNMVLFKVYRLNEIQREWVEVTHLDDHTFFIGNNCCFSVSTNRFSGCKKNCIYCTDSIFAEDEDEDYDYPGFDVDSIFAEDDGDPGFDVGIFVLKNNDSERIRRFSKYSHLFWPFQKWLMDEGVF